MTSIEHARLDAHHPAVRPEPRHRRRRARSAGGDQRRARRPAGDLRSNPTYRKVNPADAPIMILALTSRHADAGPDLRRGVEHRAAEARAGRRASARSSSAAARCRRCGSSCNPFALNQLRHRRSRTCAPRSQAANANRPKGAIEDGDRRLQIYANDQARTRRRLPRRWSSPGATARAVRLSDVAEVIDGVENIRNARPRPTASRRCS